MLKMGISSNDVYKKENKKEFEKNYIAGLHELFGENALYIFQKYNLTLKEKEYTHKSDEGIDGLTRKFVKEICVHMIHIDYKGFYQKENTQRQVVSLLETLFVCMNEENWNQYNEKDFETNKGMLFFTQFYINQGGWRENGRITFQPAEKEDDSNRIGIKTKTN